MRNQLQHNRDNRASKHGKINFIKQTIRHEIRSDGLVGSSWANDKGSLDGGAQKEQNIDV